MLKFLAGAAAFALILVVAPAQAEAQQIVVPPCPQNADCHFRGEVHERESFRSWNSGGGGYPPPPVYAHPPQYYGGGGNRQQCGNRSGGWYVGVQSDEGSLCLGGGGQRGYSNQGGGYSNQSGGQGGGRRVVDPQAAAGCHARGGVIREHANGFTCYVDPNRRY